MADYLEHSQRWQEHRQPRTPLTHWSADGDYLHPGTDPAACGSCKAHEPATGVNAGTPSDRHGADDAPDEAKGSPAPAPVAVNACNYGVHDFVYAPDSPFGGVARHAAAHVHICAECEATYIDPGAGPCFRCRHPLTPADPHDHDWADLGMPGLYGSVCRLCGETQID